MKVGILSMQRVANYGSFLQAYALKRTINSLGHEAFFVDYKAGPCLIESSAASDRISKLIKRFKQKSLRISSALKRQYFKVKPDSFNQFHFDYREKYLPLLGIDPYTFESPKTDVLVIGSDEVFNCLQPNANVGYSKDLFGENANADSVISYAASFGNTTYEGLRKYGIDKEIGHMLSDFDAISVRDTNSFRIVSKLTAQKPIMHFDPVLIYDFQRELEANRYALPFERYIVVYAYDRRISKAEGRAIRAYAKKEKAKLVALAGDQSFCDVSIYPNPFELLNIVKGALCVFTDTFHGTVFSVKFNKPFAVFVRYGEEQQYGNSQKLTDLLDKLHLSDRIVSATDDLERIIKQKIDYKSVNRLLSTGKTSTKDYLTRQLSIKD